MKKTTTATIRFRERLLILALIALAFGFFSCDLAPPVPDSPPVVIPTDPPPEDPPIDPVANPVLFALYDGTTLRYFDGENLTTAYTGDVEFAGPRTVSIDEVLYRFDDMGSVEASEWLPANPEALTLRPTGASASARSVAYSDEVYTLERIDPDTAYSLGALHEEYTRIFADSVESGAWYLNEWRVDEVFTIANGDVIARDTATFLHNLTSADEYWKAYEGGIGIRDFNPTSRNAYICDATGDYYVRWSTNYFNASKWQECDSTWYSQNGYTWNPTDGLTEQANELWGFNVSPYPVTLPYGESPVAVPAGIRYENSEWVTYWIECNSGNLFRHIPSLDRLDQTLRLYTGDGTRATGVSIASYIDPVIVADVLYFHYDGSIMQYDFGTGIVSVFAGDQEILPW